MKVVGLMVCGPGEGARYLSKTLGEFGRLCDEIVNRNGVNRSIDQKVKTRSDKRRAGTGDTRR